MDPRPRNSSTHKQLHKTGTKYVVARVDIAPKSEQAPTPLVDRGVAGFVEPAAPGKHRGPSLDQKSFPM